MSNYLHVQLLTCPIINMSHYKHVQLLRDRTLGMFFMVWMFKIMQFKNSIFFDHLDL